MVFPVGGWTRESIEVKTGIMSRLDGESGSESFGVFDMMLQVPEREVCGAGLLAEVIVVLGALFVVVCDGGSGNIALNGRCAL